MTRRQGPADSWGMKNSRRAALIVFIVALVLIIGAGFYMSLTHQETRPSGADTPPVTRP